MEEDKIKISPKLKNILEWTYCIIIAIALALLVRYYVGTPTIVKQPSMNYTLEPNQRLILSRWTRTVKGTYNRGDIITFEAPTKSSFSPYEVDMNNPVAVYENQPENIFSKFCYYVLEFNKISYIKRVIALPGEHVKIEAGKVYINGIVLDESYLPEGLMTEGETFKDIVVPEGYIFAMGDNRGQSRDCRSFGCIPTEKIESKVWIRFWPFSKFGKV